jgi:hypothetical protein
MMTAMYVTVPGASGGTVKIQGDLRRMRGRTFNR